MLAARGEFGHNGRNIIKGPLVLILSQDLPQTCLIGSEGGVLAGVVAASGGVWFCASPDDVLIEGDNIAGWRARVGGVDLRPSAPNQGGAQFQMQPAAFVFRTAQHCGFTLAGATPSAARFTAAVIFATPQDEARSLLALNTGAGNEMIFLSEAEGQVFAKDRAGGVAAALPSPRRHGAWRMAIVSFTGRALHLWADGAQTMGEGLASGLDAPADLFVGCRSNRAGLAKTLGASLVRDVFFWPNRALLAEDTSTDLAALHRYFRWSAL